MSEKPFAEYAERNGAPILEVLQRELPTDCKVLEIGSGTGQHAVRFATAMPDWVWQTSDLAENHAGILAWVEASSLANLLPPEEIDVRSATPSPANYDAVYSANTAHIMSLDAVLQMFDLVAASLVSGGAFCLYGPFKQAGKFNTDSNARFDAVLRQRDPAMGIRDIETLDERAEEGGLRRRSLYAMPANNYIAVWENVSQLSPLSD